MGFILRCIQLNDWAAKSFEECHDHVVSGVWGVGLKIRVQQHFDLVKGSVIVISHPSAERTVSSASYRSLGSVESKRKNRQHGCQRAGIDGAP